MFLILTISIVSATAAFAEMGVQMIGEPTIDTEPISLADVKLGVDVTIDGYGRLTPTTYVVQSKLGRYKKGANVPSDFWYNSGQDAKYVILTMDIVNLTMKDKNFLENIKIKAVFDDIYEFDGWAHQFNYNNDAVNSWFNEYGEYNNKQNMEFVIDVADIFPISTMYAGHFCFGVTLPNAVIDAKEPLRLVIIMDGNEITYNIRK